MSSKKLFFISVHLLLTVALLSGAVGQNSLDNPVIFKTGNGSSGNAAPYLYIKNTTQFTYLVYSDGTVTDKTYSFEDADDYDFNDIVIRTFIENDNTDTPSIFVTHLQKDADYDHEIWLSVNIPSGYRAFFEGAYYNSGLQNIRIFGSTTTSLGLTAEVKIIPVEKFSLSISPLSIEVPRNDTGIYNVALEFKDSFSGSVSLTAKGLPADTSAVFDPNTVTGNAGETKNSELKLAVGKSAPLGNHNFTVHAETTDFYREINAELRIVEASDFSISVDPPSSRVEPSKLVSFAVTVKPVGGFDGRVTLSAEGLPAGFSATIEPGSIIREGKAVLTLSIPSNANTGTYYFSIKASSGKTIHNCEVSLEVFTYTADMTITKNSNKTTATSGEEVAFSIKCQNTGDVTLKNLSISDSLEAAFEFLSASPEPGINGSEISFALGDIIPGETKTVSINVKLTDSAELIGSASNYAIASSDRIQFKRSNTVNIQVGKPALSLVKKIRNANPSFRPGGIVIYGLVIKNRGSAPVYDLNIKDQLPDSFFYISGRTLVNGAVAADPIVNSTELLWKIEKLDSGKELDIIYQVSISSAAKNGRHINSAEVTAKDGAGRTVQAGPAQVLATVSRGNILLYSSIEGTVFEDADDDGFFGAGDKPVRDVWVFLEMGVKTKTGTNGEYIFDSVLPGEHLLTVDTRSLPSDLEPDKKFYIANPLEGGREYLDIPLKIKDEGSIEGKLAWSDNVDPSISAFSLGGLKILLDSKYYILSGEDGRFIFDGIPVGSHTISIPKGFLPRGLSIVTSDSLSVDVQRRVSSPVEFILNGNPYGSLEGRVVAVAKNSNGSPVSTPVEGIALTLNESARILSDKAGNFKFDKLLPGKYQIKIDITTIEKMHYRLKSPQSVDVEIAAGKIQTIEIQLETLAFLEIKINQ
jgi:uncharacterized repeat protein (TIGR01451 family)